MNVCTQIAAPLVSQPAFLVALGMGIALLALSVRRTPAEVDAPDATDAEAVAVPVSA